MDGLAGVTVIDCSFGAVTVNTSAGEVTPLRLAVMLLVPRAIPVASPPEVMVATVVVADVQVTEAVRFCMLLSL